MKSVRKIVTDLIISQNQLTWQPLSLSQLNDFEDDLNDYNFMNLIFQLWLNE